LEFQAPGAFQLFDFGCPPIPSTHSLSRHQHQSPVIRPSQAFENGRNSNVPLTWLPKDNRAYHTEIGDRQCRALMALVIPTRSIPPWGPGGRRRIGYAQAFLRVSDHSPFLNRKPKLQCQAEHSVSYLLRASEFWLLSDMMWRFLEANSSTTTTTLISVRYDPFSTTRSAKTVVARKSALCRLVLT
jgi:hypothetical protein